MRTAISSVARDYDFILLDCPPSLSLLTLNGLCAAVISETLTASARLCRAVVFESQTRSMPRRHWKSRLMKPG
jgi:hypothetical protein